MLPLVLLLAYFALLFAALFVNLRRAYRKPTLADLGITEYDSSEAWPPWDVPSVTDGEYRLLSIRTVDPTGKTIEELVHELGNPPREDEP